ncbi:DUF3737 family protein [Paenibacillus sp. FSL E2-0178]
MIQNSTFAEGVWYRHHVYMNDCVIEALKMFRRARDIR